MLPVLFALAQSPQIHLGVKFDIVQALSQFDQSDEAVQLLLAIALDSQGSGLIQHAVIEALERIGLTNEVTLDYLLTFAENPQTIEWVRYAAVKTLGQLGCVNDTILKGLLAITQEVEGHAIEVDIRRTAYDSLKSLLSVE